MDAIKPLMDLATGFGSAAPVIGLLLFLYYRGDTERRELQAKVFTLIDQCAEAERDMTQALTVLTGKLSK